MLSVDEVKHIALLARIGLREEEIGKYQQDLSTVLDFFHELEAVTTDGIVPIGHITGTMNRARADRAVDCGQAEKSGIIKNVPETKDGFIKVKSVF
ncbi:MAG: Asp-tRNA(Asn)/Glu-tRNA(Gln) amidotransferase subunit GatC [Candidatus Moraniibacteriota bacterium]